MGVLDTALDLRSHAYREARAESLAALATLEAALDAAREGGGERAVTRHHARGRLLPRERIELLVDRDSPLLELSPVAGWGTGAPIGAAVVTAIGVVEARPCVIVADDPTIPAGGGGAATARKVRRAQRIALENRLPLLRLTEPPAEPGSPPGVATYVETGRVAAELTRLSAAGIPTVDVCFGATATATTVTGAGGASGPIPVAGEADRRGSAHTIALRSPNGRLPPPARLADHLAEDERDALRLARQCARRFPEPRGGGTPGLVVPPKHDPEDLLAVPRGQPREILARILDDSDLDEIQPGYGDTLCAGWAELHGHRVAVVASAPAAGGGDPAAAAEKARRMERLADRAGTPLLLLHQGTEPAVLTPAVPLLSLRVGHWYGPPGPPAQARLRFAWPHAGGTHGCSALELSGGLDDDGVIDPRDTRTVLGLCLSVIGP